MQHSESRPSIEILPSRRTHEVHITALWFALAVGVVGLSLALTYALAQSIMTSWIFVR